MIDLTPFTIWDKPSLKAKILEDGIIHYAWLTFGIHILSIKVEVSEYCYSTKLVITAGRVGTVHSGIVEVSVDIDRIDTTDSGVHIWARLHDVVNTLKAKYLTAQVLEIRC